ncbi:hypothetical protein HF1_12650 [Mycoplasma haemofelis str. Langford 1]|uniref:Uncharacterized protein n=1 Tax=Mycoplasma haemofelis (strain Langford 1) TaxID=941640 RepID=E8ZJF2_MYCHL|nr:hypothetical protein [Mycoplasma haemofelis]CBY93273.1 hypothetical protein HF1_12650 [Mycoplasma haemofelis str. Langford 1]
MAVSVAKASLGLGAASGAAGLGYLTSSHLFPDAEKKIPISKLFEEQGRTLLSKGSDNDQWTERWKAYVKEDKDPWRLEGYSSKKSDSSQAPEVFVNKCLSSSRLEVSGIDDPLYKQVVQNCSKEFKIDALVTEDSKITNLNITNGDEDGWKASWKNYLDDNGDQNPWSLSDWQEKKSQADQFSSDLKTKCGTKKDERVFGSKDPKFVSFVRWCSKTS